MNQLALMLTAYLALVGQPDNLRPVGDDEWQSYKLTYDKSYENQQIESLRRSVYAVNKAKLETKQTQLKQSNASYEIGVNKFTDWTQDEFNRINALMMATTETRIIGHHRHRPTPTTVRIRSDQLDWRRTKGRVSSVKDQAHCGSCWAFAAVGALEGQEMSKTTLNMSNLVDLSAQNLVDCVYDDEAHGCDGATMDDAFIYVHRMGIESDRDYPYRGHDGKCGFSRRSSVLRDSGFERVEKNEAKMQQALAGFGPIAVGIFADDSLRAYSGGIFHSSCDGKLNHAVLIVGYGADPRDGHFWIVKNSWGSKWGEGGYFRLARGNNAACVSLYPTKPSFSA